MFLPNSATATTILRMSDFQQTDQTHWSCCGCCICVLPRLLRLITRQDLCRSLLVKIIPTTRIDPLQMNEQLPYSRREQFLRTNSLRGCDLSKSRAIAARDFAIARDLHVKCVLVSIHDDSVNALSLKNWLTCWEGRRAWWRLGNCQRTHPAGGRKKCSKPGEAAGSGQDTPATRDKGAQYGGEKRHEMTFASFSLPTRKSDLSPR